MSLYSDFPWINNLKISYSIYLIMGSCILLNGLFYVEQIESPNTQIGVELNSFTLFAYQKS